MIKKCINCKNKFHTQFKNQKCCSHKCAGNINSINNRVDCLCKTCGKKFYMIKYDVAEGRGVYCSRKCCGVKHRKHDIEKIKKLWNSGMSANAIAVFLKTNPSVIRYNLKREGLYESRHAKGDGTNTWKGGKANYWANIIKTRTPQCQRCGYNKTHNVLEVHHIDCDRNNNIASNLIVFCPTCHEEEHYENKTGRYRSNKGICAHLAR